MADGVSTCLHKNCCVLIYCFNIFIAGLLQNSRYVRKRISGLQPDTVNLTKEELLELFHKLNLSIAIEPPPYSESGSGGFESGDAESGMA